MSKRIAIQEGQSSKQFGGVKQLITELPNSGDCIWVPEDEVRLTTKRIEKNGKYYAKNEKDADKKAFYGFSQVTVAISSKTNGTKNPNPPSHSGHDGDWNYPNDPNGDDYSYDTDENGNLIETKLPSSINIVTNPSKMSYHTSESINMSGAIIKAYTNNGDIWQNSGYPDGVIPLSEIKIDPTTAGAGQTGQKSATSDLETNWTQPIPLYAAVYLGLNAERYLLYHRYTCYNDAVMLIRYSEGRGFRGCVVSKRNGEVVDHIKYEYIYSSGKETTQDEQISTVNEVTKNGKTAYYTFIENEPYGFQYDEVVPDITKGQLPDPDANTIWTAVYGDISGDSQEITAKWNRPGDSKELTDTFEIQIQ